MSDLKKALNYIALNLVMLWISKSASFRANEFAEKCRFRGKSILRIFDENFMSKELPRLLPKLSLKVGQSITNFITICRIIKLAEYRQLFQSNAFSIILQILL